jgi:hypothetical protein
MKMAAKDVADSLKADFQAQIDKADELKASLAQKIQSVDDLVVQAHAEGVDEGKAMIQLPDPSSPDAQYTQQQMNDAVNAGQDQVKAQLQPQVDQLSADKAALQTQLDQVNADLVAAKQAQADAGAKLSADDAKIAQAKVDLG